MKALIKKNFRRDRRKKRIRGLGEFGSGRVFGTAEKPRLSVFRSTKHIYGQIIDDTKGKVLVSASTLAGDVRDAIKADGVKPVDKGKALANVKCAVAVGKVLAKKATAAGIGRVCFDRNGYRYHGRIKALADAAREGGLKF
jgi:large subunit ribosomal protein L18